MLSGILSVVCASLLFGIVPSGNNYVLLQGMSEPCLLFYESGVMAAGSLLLALLRKETLRIPFSEIIRLMLLGLSGMYATNLLLNTAYTRLPVGIVIMLNFLYPIIVLLISTLLFRERFSLYSLFAVLCGLGGLFFVADPRGGGFDLNGALPALASGVTYAVFVVANERSAVRKRPLFVRLFYMSLLTAAVSFVQSAAGRVFSLPGNFRTALVTFCVVGCGSLSAYALMMTGIRKIGASRSSIINMLEPIAAVVFGVLLFQEPLSAKTILGGVLILASVLITTIDGLR